MSGTGSDGLVELDLKKIVKIGPSSPTKKLYMEANDNQTLTDWQQNQSKQTNVIVSEQLQASTQKLLCDHHTD